MSNEASRPLYRGTQIIWSIFALIEAFLLLRFVLKLLQANPRAGFTDTIYTISGIFTAPFEAVFRNVYVSGSVFEWTTLLAMLIYWFIAMAIIKLFVMGKPMTTAEADAKLGAQDPQNPSV
ncbi:MAG: hypothetical protein AAB845_00100 [Patescibacteria group bacterium]